MSLYSEIREALSFGIGKRKSQRTEREGLIVLSGIAAVLMAIAVAVLLNTSASGSNGLKACNGILLSNQRYECLGMLANETGNYSVCTFIRPQSSSYHCISALARKNSNASACRMINSSSYQYDQCMENVSYSTGNVSYCLGLKGENESACAYGIARQDRFSSIQSCNLISDQSEKEKCTYIYYYSAALGSGIPSYCAFLPNKTNSSMLATIVSKDYTNDSATNFTFLAYSDLNITVRSYCYYKLALKLNDSTLCSYTNTGISQLCIESLTSAASSPITNISSVCSTSSPSNLKSVCRYGLYTSQALNERNISACFAIANATYEDSCVAQLAASYNDSAYCGYITDNSSLRTACNESVNINTGKG